MLKLVPFLILATPAAGFLFCGTCLKYKYLFPREDGQRLYLRSFVFGFPFIAISLAINIALYKLPQLVAWPEAITFQLPFNDGALVAVMASPGYALLFAKIYNLVVKKLGTEVELFRDAMLTNDVDKILWLSMSRYHPVAVSLENRKVYVGLVADGLEPGVESYLTILPLLTGYRDKDTLRLTISARYTPVFDLLKKLESTTEADEISDLESYCIAFPRNTIVSIHLFNDQLYQHVSSQYCAAEGKGNA